MSSKVNFIRFAVSEEFVSGPLLHGRGTAIIQSPMPSVYAQNPVQYVEKVQKYLETKSWYLGQFEVVAVKPSNLWTEYATRNQTPYRTGCYAAPANYLPKYNQQTKTFGTPNLCRFIGWVYGHAFDTILIEKPQGIGYTALSSIERDCPIDIPDYPELCAYIEPHNLQPEWGDWKLRRACPFFANRAYLQQLILELNAARVAFFDGINDAIVCKELQIKLGIPFEKTGKNVYSSERILTPFGKEIRAKYNIFTENQSVKDIRLELKV